MNCFDKVLMCSCWSMQCSSAIKFHYFHKGTVYAAYSEMMWASLERNVTAVYQRNRKGLKHQFLTHVVSSFLQYTFQCAFVLCNNEKTHGWMIDFNLTENTVFVRRTFVHHVIHEFGNFFCILMWTNLHSVSFFIILNVMLFQNWLFI